MKYFTFLFCLLYASTSWSQVVINEVYPTTNQIEIKNIGNDVINMIGGRIFDGLQGDMLLDNIIPTECGDFILTPGEITVFTFVTDILETEGQLLLQGVASNPVSFLQWGGIQSLASFAFSSGIWDDPTAFLPAVGSTQSFQLIDPDNRRSPEGYLRANPSLCDDNIGCEITQVDLRALSCNDNQTPSDPTDDFFTFIAYVAGTNIMGNVDLILDEGSLSPSSVPAACNSCEVASSIGTANGEDYALTITANNGDCIYIEVFTAPASCSPDCEILYEQVLNLTCNDNGTSSNPDDDYLEFLFQAWGFNLSETGYYLTFPDGTELGPYTYQNDHLISTQGLWPAGLGDFPLIVQDADDATCEKTVTILSPGACSDGCNFEAINIFGINCNDNGTSQDPSDDFLTFELEVLGMNLGDQYLISSPQIEITPQFGSSLTVSQFSTAAGIGDIGDISFNLVDASDPECTISDVLVNPGACSEECSLSPNILSITCNNNGTPEDDTDDFYQLDLQVSGINTSGFYTASIQPFEIMAQTLAYNTLYTFTTPPGSASELEGFGFTFLDAEQPCTAITLSGFFDGPCSDGCSLSTDILSITCNNNGTPADDTDDFYQLDLQVSGINTSGFYTASIQPFEIAAQTLEYNTLYTFTTAPGSASELESFGLTFLDAEQSCIGITLNGLFDGPCSDGCSLSTDLLLISCNNNDTPSDSTDDFYQLDLQLSGTNTSNFYTASIQPFETETQTLEYNTLYQFATPPGSASELEGYGLNFLDAEKPCTGFTLNGSFENDCVVTNTREVLGPDQIQLFPNPTNGLLQVSIADNLLKAAPVSVQVRNMQSVLLRQEILLDKSIDLAVLPSGAYLIMLQTDAWISRQVIIKS